MSRSVRGAHVLPITALAYLDGDIVLSGEGNQLCAHDIHTHSLVEGWTIFEHQAIHGIVTDPKSAHVLVYGGRFIKILTVDQPAHTTSRIDLEQSTLLDAGDWILAATFDDGIAALITAHNALITARPAAPSVISTNKEWKLSSLVSGSNTILYSAHVLRQGDNGWLVAAGTAFGDVIVWSCNFSSEIGVSDADEATCTTHYSFSAHEGSTFDVHISDSSLPTLSGGQTRLLASCSDDRTVRLWNISDLPDIATHTSTVTRSTGFGTSATDDDAHHGRPALLAKVMGHISRIWHVRFQLSSQQQVLIKSFGEDATTITWTLTVASGTNEPIPYRLTQAEHLSLNTGKHIWSVSVLPGGHFTVGGGDGAIGILPSSIDGLHSSGQLYWEEEASSKRDAIKAYAFADSHTLVSTTQQGLVLIHELKERGMHLLARYTQPDLANYSTLAAAAGVVFVGGTRSYIYAWYRGCTELMALEVGPGKTSALFANDLGQYLDGTTAAASDISLLVAKVNQPELALVLFSIGKHGTELHKVSSTSVALSTDFHATSAAQFIPAGHLLITAVGSRDGRLILFTTKLDTARELLVQVQQVTMIHQEAVTSVTWHIAGKPERSDDVLLGHLLSTSRDGSYAIHRIAWDGTAIGTLQVEKLHQLELPFGPNIEGLLVKKDTVLIWGFKSKQFVVYSLAELREVFSIDCGGAHRQWAIRPSEKGLAFVWTQASNVYYQIYQASPRKLIKSGGHGREIKSMAITAHFPNVPLIATGGQDTDIRLFTLVIDHDASLPRPRKDIHKLNCIHILRKHNTGPQCLSFSDDGQYLFSSGGFEEFFIWRLTSDCPAHDIGVLCESAHPRCGQSDLRITSFHSKREVDDKLSWTFALAYSDSRVALWSYSRDGGWKHLVEADYLTSCPTMIWQLSHTGAQTRYLSTATDGHLAQWQHSVHESSHSLQWTDRHAAHRGAILSCAVQHERNISIIATGGDDNALALTRYGSHSSTLHSFSIARAHAAAITAVCTTPLDTELSSLYLISAGLDQRIILWQLVLRQNVQQGEPWVRVRKLRVICSSVADISSIGIMPRADATTSAIQIVVSGIGMEIWTLIP